MFQALYGGCFVEWKEDYVPPKMRHSTSNSSSVESPKNDRKPTRRNMENIKNSPKQAERSSPRQILKLYKRTLDTSDSSGEIGAPAEKIRKRTSNLCNGAIYMTEQNQVKDVHSMSVQVGSSLCMGSQEPVGLVSASAQVGDSLQIMDNGVTSAQDENANSQRTESAITKKDSNDCDKDRSSNNLTPIVETQAQRVPTSGSTESTRHSGENILTDGTETSRTSTSQESRSNGLQLDTIVQPVKYLIVHHRALSVTWSHCNSFNMH